jgi:branched-chain amino acid transport system ATP-binding protein
MVTLLNVDGLDTGYGRKQVLYGLSLAVEEHQIVSLIGPNGAGKSTVLKTVAGLLRPWSGHISFPSLSAEARRLKLNIDGGMVLIPQGKRVFPNLTVAENLSMGGWGLTKPAAKQRIDEFLHRFPILRDRAYQLASTLSGGEQQIVALARGLIPHPRLLMLDEPTVGLAPELARDTLAAIRSLVIEVGAAALIVEHKVRAALRISDKVYALRLGRVAHSGDARTLLDDSARLASLFA